jgi:hypothetical protein
VSDTRKYLLGGSHLGCPCLDCNAEACLRKLVDAPRRIRALEDALTATKSMREGGERTVGKARCSTLAAASSRAAVDGIGCSACRAARLGSIYEPARGRES